jgi:ribonuclease P protein component
VDDVSYGFSRKLRLITKADYHQVFRKSRRYSDKYWTVLVHTNTLQASPRLGLAIAKKRAKRAVDRNRIKRIAREAFRHRQCDLQGYHLVVMNKDAAASVSVFTLRESLEDLLSQIVLKAERGRS